MSFPDRDLILSQPEKPGCSIQKSHIWATRELGKARLYKK